MTALLFSDETTAEGQGAVGSMRHEATIALFQYWNRLRNGRAAPRRTEIEPADIKSLLADTFILERDARGEAAFRLAGTRLCATYGRELKGYSYPLIWARRDQRMLSRLAYGTFQDKTVVVVTFDGFTETGRSQAFEMIMLPLEGGMGSPRLLGAVTPFEKPYWLGADPIREGRVDSIRVVDPEREPLFLSNRPAVTVPSLDPGDGQLFGDGAGPSSGGRRIRHLVVFNGGRES